MSTLRVLPLMFSVGCLAFPAHAQSPALPPPVKELAQLSVQIWPEFDKPAVLMMMDAQLAATVKLPATVEVKIPAVAGKPHAVAERGPDNKLYVANYKTETKAAWATVSVVANQRVVHVEYYLPLDRSKPQRKFSFEWPAAPAIGNVILGVQNPKAATKLTTTPAATKLSRDGRGLAMHLVELGSRKGGADLKLEVSYVNEKGALTKDLLVAQAPAAPTGATTPPPPTVTPKMAVPTEPKKKDSNTWLYVVIAAAAAFGVGFAIATHRRREDDE